MYYSCAKGLGLSDETVASLQERVNNPHEHDSKKDYRPSDSKYFMVGGFGIIVVTILIKYLYL